MRLGSEKDGTNGSSSESVKGRMKILEELVLIFRISILNLILGYGKSLNLGLQRLEDRWLTLYFTLTEGSSDE